MSTAAARRPLGYEALRMFLRRTAPSSLVVHTELGDRTVSCKSQAWRELADTVVSMRPHGVVEAFDLKGALLKTFDAARLGWDESSDAPAPTSAAQSDMYMVGRLLADAYRHSNEVLRLEHQEAFQQVVKLVEIAFRRLEVIETGWNRMVRERVREIEQREGDAEAGAEGGLADQVLRSMAGGMIKAQLEQATTNGTTTNGNGTHVKPKKGAPRGDT